MASRVTIISGSIGAGHDGAAGELGRRLFHRGYAVRRLDFVDLVGVRPGRALRRGYAAELAAAPRTWGWLHGALSSRWLSSGTASAAYRLAAARTRAALTPPPDLVVSVYPAASQVLGRLRRAGVLSAPVVTFLTDMAVHPLWVARGVDAHVALHEIPARQASGQGAAEVRVGGAAVRPEFRPAIVPASEAAERAAIRTRYDIPADRPAALVVSGSWGVGDVLASAADIATGSGAMPVVLCGTNTALREALRDRRLGVALGWVDDLAPLIRACDVVVQNAGGLTSLEAMACGVPVLSYRCLPGHGQTNAAALESAGLAAWPRDPAALGRALAAAVSAPRPPVPPLVTADPAEQIAALLSAGSLPPAGSLPAGSMQEVSA